MIKKGWIIGIALTVISFAWIPFVMIPMMFMEGFDQQHIQPIPEPVERMIPEPAPQVITEPNTQQVPAPNPQQVPEPIPQPAPLENNCDPSYPDVCIPYFPPDLDCEEISYTDFKVIPPDPHGFDRDNDGIGCES